MYLNHHHFGNYPLLNKHTFFNSYVKVPEGVSNIYPAAKTLAYCSTTPKANFTPTFVASKTNEPNLFGGWFGDDPTTDTLP